MAALPLTDAHLDLCLSAPQAQPASSYSGDIVRKGGYVNAALSDIVSCKREELSSFIKQIVEEMGLVVMLVPEISGVWPWVR